MIEFKIDAVDWAKGDGLIPLVAQDAVTLRVLMQGYVNRAALEQTVQTGLVTFYSRTKQRLWQKGETSGNVLRVKSLHLDCDADTILAMVEPAGATCHTGTETCFGDMLGANLSVLGDLQKTIQHRHKNPVEGSYTARLFQDGLTRIAQKVGEEGVETALAAATKGDNLADEAADLLYHLLVLLEASDKNFSDVLGVLQSRAKK